MTRQKLYLLALLTVVPMLANAEERFYQVMDANGRMQTVRQPADETDKKEGRKNSEAGSDQVVKKTKSGQKKEVPAPGSVLPAYAPYDGDSYLDSEVMDASHQKSDRKNFFILNDGVGQRIESTDGLQETGVAVPQVTDNVRDYIELQDISLRRPVSRAVNVKNGCLSRAQLAQSADLQASQLADVLFDGKVLNYVRSGQLLKTYQIAGVGIKTLTLRSYARTDDAPDFVMPLIGFADEKGCITRIEDGYFQRFYRATKSKHAMLEAGLILHADDAYVLVIVPSGKDVQDELKTKYRVSSLGRVSIKWKP